LVELIRMTIEERKDALELGECVCADLHDGRLVGLYHGHGARRCPRVGARAGGLVSGRGRGSLVVVRVEGRGGLRKGGRRRLLGWRERCGRGRARRCSIGRRLLLQMGSSSPLRHEGQNCSGCGISTASQRHNWAGEGVQKQGEDRLHLFTSLGTAHGGGLGATKHSAPCKQEKILALRDTADANGRVVNGASNRPRNATGTPASCKDARRFPARNRVTTGGQYRVLRCEEWEAGGYAGQDRAERVRV
jgi:hypothetical protein